MAASVVAFLTTALLSQALGLGPIALVMLSWLAILAVMVASGQSIPVVPTLLRFLAGFTLIVVVESFTWTWQYRISNLLGSVLFFFVIPSVVVALAISRPGALRKMEIGVFVAFVALTLCTLVYGLVAGVDLQQRAEVFVPKMQKNGVSAVYEAVFIYTFASARRRVDLQAACLVAAVPALVILGSKTGLGLSVLFALGLWARWLFVAAAPAALAGVILEALKFDFESSVRTAAFRILTWQQAWQEITASPRTLAFGNGPATFESKLEAFSGLAGTHNLILQFWHSYGLVMVVLMLGLFVWVWRRFGFWSSPGIVAFWLFNSHALFDVGWVNGSGFVAALVFGLGLAAAIEGAPARAAAVREPSAGSLDLGRAPPVPGY